MGRRPQRYARRQWKRDRNKRGYWLEQQIRDRPTPDKEGE